MNNDWWLIIFQNTIFLAIESSVHTKTPFQATKQNNQRTNLLLTLILMEAVVAFSFPHNHS